jgi:hypothetical protein
MENNYKALVTTAHVRPHPNADKLQLATVNGYQVILGLDVQDGDMGLFFEGGRVMNTRKQIQFEIWKRIKDLTGVKPLEVTLTNSGVALVFDNHSDFATVYHFFRFGEGERIAGISETDFDEQTGLRFLVLDMDKPTRTVLRVSKEDIEKAESDSNADEEPQKA